MNESYVLFILLLVPLNIPNNLKIDYKIKSKWLQNWNAKHSLAFTFLDGRWNGIWVHFCESSVVKMVYKIDRVRWWVDYSTVWILLILMRFIVSPFSFCQFCFDKELLLKSCNVFVLCLCVCASNPFFCQMPLWTCKKIDTKGNCLSCGKPVLCI